MSPSPILLRTAAVSALAVAVLATSGCGWFRKENALYTQSPENRPLEVPPDLDRPGTAGALVAPDQLPRRGKPFAAGHDLVDHAHREQLLDRVDAGVEHHPAAHGSGGGGGIRLPRVR